MQLDKVGKYQQEGLNIGKSDAWGCRVQGYTQGLDCTHFVEWILYQNHSAACLDILSIKEVYALNTR